LYVQILGPPSSHSIGILELCAANAKWRAKSGEVSGQRVSESDGAGGGGGSWVGVARDKAEGRRSYWRSVLVHASVAYPANKTVRMPLAVEGRYVVLHDGAVASAALGGEHVEVVVPAVGLAVPLVEALLAELLAALGAEEVLRVPGLLERGHAFLRRQKWITRAARDWPGDYPERRSGLPLPPASGPRPRGNPAAVISSWPGPRRPRRSPIPCRAARPPSTDPAGPTSRMGPLQ
jgi:hypothetical protein